MLLTRAFFLTRTRILILIVLITNDVFRCGGGERGRSARGAGAAAAASEEEEEIKYLIRDAESDRATRVRASVDGEFARQLSALIRVVLKGWCSAETALVAGVAASLVARSLCDLWLIHNGTLVEASIVGGDPSLFRRRVLRLLCMMPLVAVVNNALKWSIGQLKLRLRANLTRSLLDEYLGSLTYYRMVHLDGRIANADQLLTADVERFCDSLTDLYSNVAKPLLDIGIYVHRLTTSLGGETPAILLAYLAVSGAVLTRLRRPTARLTAGEQRLEGEFRHINARLIAHSEEVAFYGGHRRERQTLLASFHKLMSHARRFLLFRTWMGAVDNLVAKYLATVVGFWAVSRPFMSREHALYSDAGDERFRRYYTSGRMLVKLAEAIGRLVLAGRELTRLAGYAARVTQLRVVLREVAAGRYERSMLRPLSPGAGRLVFRDGLIRFDAVPLATPNGDVLVEQLTFEVRAGQNVLVCGPNGCGKSSLFRVLGELWPLFGGTLTKPPRSRLFYVPQRPYMTLGSLRDQITYPHSRAEALRRGATDEALLKHLERVQLSYLAEREGGLDAVADWLDVLSGGEKQRVAMARLFHHAPQFAILDECTSAVSVDVEGSIYDFCRQQNITLFTVSHRRSLWKHHEYVLQFDGRGAYTFSPIDHDCSDQHFGS